MSCFFIYNIEWKFRRSSFGVLQLLRRVSVSFQFSFIRTFCPQWSNNEGKKQRSQAESVSPKTSSFLNTACPGSKHDPVVTAGTSALEQEKVLLCARLIFKTCFVLTGTLLSYVTLIVVNLLTCMVHVIQAAAKNHLSKPIH